MLIGDLGGEASALFRFLAEIIGGFIGHAWEPPAAISRCRKRSLLSVGSRLLLAELSIELSGVVVGSKADLKDNPTVRQHFRLEYCCFDPVGIESIAKIFYHFGGRYISWLGNVHVSRRGNCHIANFLLAQPSCRTPIT